jgi:hypothetical protein
VSSNTDYGLSNQHDARRSADSRTSRSLSMRSRQSRPRSALWYSFRATRRAGSLRLPAMTPAKTGNRHHAHPQRRRAGPVAVSRAPPGAPQQYSHACLTTFASFASSPLDQRHLSAWRHPPCRRPQPLAKALCFVRTQEIDHVEHTNVVSLRGLL